MQIDLIIENWTLFYSGVKTTLMLIVVVFASSFIIALPLAVLRAYEVAGVRWVIHGYTRVARGTPLLVQVYIITAAVLYILITYSISWLFRRLERRYLTPLAMS